MLNHFQAATAYSMTRPVSTNIIDQQDRGLVHIGEIARRQKELWQMDQHERSRIIHEKALRQVNLARAVVRCNPGNYRAVYELCKKVYELAELERVDFNGAESFDKMKFIRQLIPFADTSALAEGVREYHDSRASMNWGMHFLDEGVSAVEKVLTI